MKKSIKFIGLLIAVAVMLSSILTFSVSAAGSTLHIKKSEVTVGENVEVRVTYSDGQPVYTIDVVLNYDSSLLTFVSCTAQADSSGGTVHISDENCAGDYTFVFKAVAEGNYRFVSNAYGVNYDYQKVYAPPQGGNITIKAPATSSSSTPPVSSESTSSTASSNASLKSLSVSGATLSPAFSKNTTGYTATVQNTVEKVTVKASAADSGAKVEGAGTYPLDIGNNKISITVTAADGTTRKEYAISIKRNTADEDAAQTVSGEGEENPLKVTIDGKEYTVIADISALNIPTGFTQTTTLYNDIEVGCLTEPSDSYKLYWLNDEIAQQPVLFSYSEDGEFERLVYTEIGGKFYIFTRPESGLEAPDGFYETTLSFDSGNAMAFAYTNSRMTDFYIVYCWCDGEARFYRYDKLENTIQRAPDFSMVEAVDAEPEVKNDTVVDWFMNLSGVAKLVIIVALCAVIVLITLVVLLILMIKNRRIASPVLMLDDDDAPLTEDGFTFGEAEKEVMPEAEISAQPEPQTKEAEEDIIENEDQDISEDEE